MSRAKHTLPDAAEIDAVILASKYLPLGDAADSRVAAAVAAAAADAPPRLTGGESPQNTPISKGYEKILELLHSPVVQEYEFFQVTLTNEKGQLIEVPLRRGRDDAALIDQLTFTVHESTIPKFLGYPLVSDNEYIVAYSKIIDAIFGFGVSEKLPHKGKFFYEVCYRLGPVDVQYGTLHYGGQRDTILIELNGTGCQAAKAGWETRLHEFLKQAVRPHITRVDVAHDFFQGEYTPEQALIDHDHGLFNSSGRSPKSECVGSAWRSEDYSGKTFYVGRRGSFKFVRVYEKGRAFGDKDSDWVRFEIEFRAQKNTHIPLDILISPGSYLAGSYPELSIFDTCSRRIETIAKTVQITYEQRIFHARNQVGRLMNFLLDTGKDPVEICQMLKAEDGLYPKGLMPEQYDAGKAQDVYLHQYFDDDILLDIDFPSYSSRPTTGKPKGFEDLSSLDIQEELDCLIK